MNLRKFVFSILIFSFPFFAFCQSEEPVEVTVEDPVVEVPEEAPVEEVSEAEEEVNIKGKDFKSSENFREFIRSLDYVLDFGPSVYVNTKSTLVSAPSPAFFPVSMGILWPNYTFIAMQPSVSVSYMYYLWHDGMALPAEVENRTALTVNILANLPMMVQLYMKKSRVQIMGGIAFLGRVGMLPPGVSENDSGESGSAGGDLKLINKWFYDNTRFLYISTGVSWLFNLNEEGTKKAGPEIKAYLPIGGIMNSEGMQGMIITVGMKISL